MSPLRADVYAVLASWMMITCDVTMIILYNGYNAMSSPSHVYL